MEEKKYIVAIYFGSSRTGYAYSLLKEGSNVNFGRFKNTGEKIKTLNQVVLNDSNEIIKYGCEIENFLKQKKQTGNENWHLFNRIKMNLYENKYEIKAVNSSKIISLTEIIYKILDYIKKHVIENIVNTNNGIQGEYDYDSESNKIRWVLTIPAIWDEQNKYIMMQAAEKANIVS